jgi:hypothetical protein
MTPVTRFLAFDKTEFDNEAECRAYEKRFAHLRLIGLTEAQITAALAGDDADLADAIEVVGGRIARARVAGGKRKRQPNGGAEQAQITHQAEGDPARDPETDEEAGEEAEPETDREFAEVEE